MRVALVSDCYLPRLGGIELQVHDLAEQLIRAGNDVTVYTITDGPSAVGDVPVVRLPALTGLPFPSAVDRLRAELPEFDVVHCHTSLLSPFTWRAARVTKNAIVTLHSLPSSSTPFPIERIDRFMGDVQWTAVSEAVAAVLRRLLPDRSVEVLHNGVDPVMWRQPRRPGHPLTVVSTMRLTRRKRPLALMRTLEEIRELVPAELPLRAVIVGSGPQAGAVARVARRRGLRDWVDLPGRLTRFEIQQLYAQADVYLAPSELESFGVAALEARCAGLPVVAMSSGGVGEFIRPGIEGYLVDTDSQMASTVAALLTSPATLARIQEFNQQTDPVMTWQNVVTRHLLAYKAQVALRTPSLASAP